MDTPSLFARNSVRGVILVLCAGLLWGTTGTAQSFSANTLSPYWVGALRLVISAAFFTLYIVATIGLRAIRASMAMVDWRHAVLAGACMAGYNLAFFAGVKATGVAVGTALALGSGPIWAGLLQMLGGRAPSGHWWAGTMLAVAGGVLLVLGRGGTLQADPTGIALCLAAGLTYALYAIINKRMVHRADPGVVTLAVFSVAAAIALPAAWLWAGELAITGRGWAVVLFLGVVATGVAYLLFSNGLRGITAATGVSLALMEPITAFLLAIAVIGERPELAAYLGLAALLVGLSIVIRAEVRRTA
ncbi:MAG: DMT family transporter [Alcaligenaceae bacterium]|nr:DMT family transporter [Alcaligenaceae bacterium]